MMKKVSLVHVFLCLIYSIITISNSLAQLKFGTIIEDDIAKMITQWLGEEPIAKGKTVFEWLELEVYSTKSGHRIFADSKSKRFIMVLMNQQQINEKLTKDVGLEEALNYALTWMKQRNIHLNGWSLTEKRRYDRGSAGVEYMFTWQKFSPQGVQLPSLMRLLVSGGGEVNFWFCIDEPVKISLIPKISNEKALDMAQSIVGLKYKIASHPKLRIWFREKQQQLWWEITFINFDNKNDWCIVVINAHTGELIDLIAPLGRNWLEEQKRKYFTNAQKIAKELKQCIKIEIFCLRATKNPIAIFKQKDKKFQKFVFLVRRLLKSGEGISGSPPYGLIGEFPLIRFYITPNIAYEAKLDLKVAYFEILGKSQLKKQGSQMFWKRIERISVVVDKCPKEFTKEVNEILRSIMANQ